MRIVFFGTPTFAVPTLKALLRSPHEVLGVVTQPDARRGRGNQLSPSPVKAVALAASLPIWQPQRLKKDPAVLASLAHLEADAFVVVAYGQILSPEVLALPRHGCINVHGSLLPKYRGAAPIQWSLANGDSETGITTMLMDAGIDTGAMLLKVATPIHPDDNAETLGDRLAHLGAELLLATLDQLPYLNPIPQIEAKATYAPLLRKEDWMVDWTQPALTLHHRCRGFYPNSYTSWRGSRLKILQTLVKPGTGTPGTLTAIDPQGLWVATGQDWLGLVTVQPEGKRPQSAKDFANGQRLTPGVSFG
ncbi:MAG: methionyl-tRNA formyltransferase [Pseudanabaenaceae cyanobacterium]